jgi:DNA (cytosine-5)-methyltransferase 1
MKGKTMIAAARDDGGLFAASDRVPHRIRDMSTDPTRPLAVDLFAGAGGLSLGFEQAGYDIAAAVEYDPTHAAVHENNFPYSTTFCRDVSTLSGEEIRQHSTIGDREIHVVAGGPPCQGISMIGKRALDDPRNALLGQFARLVIEMRPRYFVMENVAGLTVGSHRQLLDEVVGVMVEAGYNVVLPYRVLQAADFGTPQSRKRLVLLGSRADVPVPAYPTPSFTPRTLRGSIPARVPLPLGPSVKDALGDLPDADRYATLLDHDQTPATFGEPSAYSGPLRGVVRELDDFSRPRRFDARVLTSSARTVHTDLSVSRFASTPPGATEPVSRFLRLHPEGIANTLRAGTASDRGAYTAPRPIHPFFPRVITVREAARLHGYPDWFRFHVTKWNGFREIGNSVPARLGRAVASALLAADGVAPVHGAEIEPGNLALLSFTASQAERYFGISERIIAQRDRKAG